MPRVRGRELVLVHIRDGRVVLRKQGKHNGRGTGWEIVDLVERERSDHGYEQERRKQDGIRQCG